MTIHIARYTDHQATLWNQFISCSKNATFLFHRDYMDYHRDRFIDHSLLIYDKNQLIAVFPANRDKDQLYSHQGLSYGGLLTDANMRAPLMLEVVKHLRDYGRAIGVSAIHYKAIPHIYHQYPAEEDLYALVSEGAYIKQVDISTTIKVSERLPLHKGKKYGLARAQKAGVIIQQSKDYEQYYSIVKANLQERHQGKPVHTVEEISRLAAHFPDNIKLFAAFSDGTMIAGAIVYLTHQVVHTQYIASTPLGRELSAVEYLLAKLIDTLPAKHVYFDFGTSTLKDTRLLNTGLVQQKEGFGGRGIVYQQFHWPLTENKDMESEWQSNSAKLFS